MTGRTRNGAAGFSLVDLLLVISLVSIVSGIAVPVATDAAEGVRLGMATREVERQLQSARLRAVSANRPLLVRMSCPGVGQLRVVEITGVATTDGDANRCDETRFPYPGPKDSDRATPELDGPVRTLHFTVTLSGSDLQFLPNGTTQEVVGGAATPITAPVELTVTYDSESSRVAVNGLGKIAVR